MYSFLLIGQSNMAGRGSLDEAPAITNNRLYVMRNGRWLKMYRPVNCDRPFSGVCLAESFADACSKYYNADIGLIPCADGGTSLNQWMPGDVIYDHAVFQAKLAMRSSQLAGILWHQGEADCAPDLYPHYEEKCTYIFENMRKDLGISDVPFLVGGLGSFLPLHSETLGNYHHVNKALQDMAQHQDYISYVCAEGLGAKDDNLHFNTAALYEFGERYFEVFRAKNTVITASAREQFNDGLTEMERL